MFTNLLFYISIYIYPYFVYLFPNKSQILYNHGKSIIMAINLYLWNFVYYCVLQTEMKQKRVIFKRLGRVCVYNYVSGSWYNLSHIHIIIDGMFNYAWLSISIVKCGYHLNKYFCLHNILYTQENPLAKKYATTTINSNIKILLLHFIFLHIIWFKIQYVGSVIKECCRNK